MSGIHLDAVSELDEPSQRVEEPLGALARLDREVGPCGISDEERVAGEDDPRIVAARPIADREAAMLWSVTWCVDAAQDDVAEPDLRSVGHRVVRVLGVGCRMDAHRDAVLEREPPVPGEVVGVRVRLDRADDADIALRGFFEILLDREGRIDHDRVTGTGIADEVGGAAERVVDELREDHGRARPYQRVPLFLLKYRRASSFQRRLAKLLSRPLRARAAVTATVDAHGRRRV